MVEHHAATSSLGCGGGCPHIPHVTAPSCIYSCLFESCTSSKVGPDYTEANAAHEFKHNPNWYQTEPMNPFVVAECCRFINDEVKAAQNFSPSLPLLEEYAGVPSM